MESREAAARSGTWAGLGRARKKAPDTEPAPGSSCRTLEPGRLPGRWASVGLPPGTGGRATGTLGADGSFLSPSGWWSHGCVSVNADE